MAEIKTGTKKLNVEAVSSERKKKLLSVVILGAMIINGFGLSIRESGRAGKDSLALIAIAVTQNMIVAAIEKCNNSLTEVSKKVSEYIGEALFGGIGARKASKENGSRDGGERGGEEQGIILTQKTIEKEKGMAGANKIVDNAVGVFRGADTKGDIGDLGRGKIIVLLFIIFIGVIKQRKVFGDTGVSIVEIKQGRK